MSDNLSVMHFFPRIRSEEGGVVKTIIDLCELLAQAGHRVQLATCDATDVPSRWRDSPGNSPQVVELPKSRRLPGFLSHEGLARFREVAREVDAVHLHTPWEIANVQLASVLKKTHTPYVVSVHGMLDDYCMEQKRLKKRLFLALGGRRLFRDAALVHYTAEGELEQASKWIPQAAKYCVQACAMDLAPYHQLPGTGLALDSFPYLQSDMKKMLFLSRLHSKKGLEMLLEAAALLRRRQIGFELLIAGPGDEQYTNRLKSLAKQLDVHEQTHFLGMVRGDLKLSLYQLADVFVLPTYQENFGLVLPEALACGTPVVTTRGTDIWPELEQAGAKIVGFSPLEIADAIAALLADDAERNRLGDQGRSYVLQWLDPKIVTTGYERMYRTVQNHGLGTPEDTPLRNNVHGR